MYCYVVDQPKVILLLLFGLEFHYGASSYWQDHADGRYRCMRIDLVFWIGSFLGVGVVLDVVAEVEVGAKAKLVAQIHWSVARGGCFNACYVQRPRVYVSEVCLCSRVACLRLQ
jgi:hypothetical protein